MSTAETPQSIDVTQTTGTEPQTARYHPVATG
jgi:hypothetical protein